MISLLLDGWNGHSKAAAQLGAAFSFRFRETLSGRNDLGLEERA
jgi:hypothetical protein